MFICIACPVWKSLTENSSRDSWAFSNRGEAEELYLLNCLECTMVDLGWLTAWCCLFPYSTLYHHHLPIPVCCHVWGFWPWNPDDSDCCLDGGEGKPDSVPEEWQWGNVADHAELCISNKELQLSLLPSFSPWFDNAHYSYFGIFGVHVQAGKPEEHTHTQSSVIS